MPEIKDADEMTKALNRAIYDAAQKRCWMERKKQTLSTAVPAKEEACDATDQEKAERAMWVWFIQGWKSVHRDSKRIVVQCLVSLGDDALLGNSPIFICTYSRPRVARAVGAEEQSVCQCLSSLRLVSEKT